MTPEEISLLNKVLGEKLVSVDENERRQAQLTISDFCRTFCQENGLVPTGKRDERLVSLDDVLYVDSYIVVNRADVDLATMTGVDLRSLIAEKLRRSHIALSAELYKEVLRKANTAKQSDIIRLLAIEWFIELAFCLDPALKAETKLQKVVEVLYGKKEPLKPDEYSLQAIKDLLASFKEAGMDPFASNHEGESLKSALLKAIKV